MKDLIQFLAVTLAVLSIWHGGNAMAKAQDLEVRLSSREAYVDMPIVLQISIRDSDDFQSPVVPEIDGCDIRMAGTPSRNSQITIINGRRSESVTTTIQYLITPLRVGSFEVPPIEMQFDGKSRRTRRLKFNATRSETGDLMFVEIEGSREKVYVGQPLDLTLKIWIKPYRDDEHQITLSEANMWQMISGRTSWGGFIDRLQELAQNNQRPGGPQVSRKDKQGNEVPYYLYEIEATVYPNRPGKIDADDVKIIFNYPTGLGRSRDPFEAFFESGTLRGQMNRLLDDDFPSMSFSRRLSVTSSRPIVARARVDSTEVLPVPVSGRPPDYRGAVGQYNIVTRATPYEVNAGDPVTLSIGIPGDGPMELVQAPPLSTIRSLTADFRVASQPLAGFVQDNTKFFSTTIRPRREGISQIPAIPFSFFDPETESFRTVYSEPIAIKVNQSETLALDSIIGNAKREPVDENGSASTILPNRPDLMNHMSPEILVSQTMNRDFTAFRLIIGVPPFVWLLTLVVVYRKSILKRLAGFRSARTRCLSEIRRSIDNQELVEALVQYVSRRFSIPCSTSIRAMGALRTSGMTLLANEIEMFISQCEREFQASPDQDNLSTGKNNAARFVERIEDELASTGKSGIRRPSRSRAMKIVRSSGLGILCFLSASVFAAIPEIHAGSLSVSVNTSSGGGKESIVLTASQRQTLLEEANRIYARARESVKTDAADARESFVTACSKYQLLVDSGIRNSKLYINLGNACLQSGETGRAIANYIRARQLDPSDSQAWNNLTFARSLTKPSPAVSRSEDVNRRFISWSTLIEHARNANARFVRAIGFSTLTVLMTISSLLFWGIIIVRTAGFRFPTMRFAVFPLVLLTIMLTSYAAVQTEIATVQRTGVLVNDQLVLHAGDGTRFAKKHVLETVEGLEVRILSQRSNWLQIETATGQTGWARSSSIEQIQLP